MVPKISVNFCDGCHVKIDCQNHFTYRVLITDGQKVFVDVTTDDELISSEIGSENYKFIEYHVFVYHEENLIFSESINLSGKKVKINFDSKALGDNIAWIEQVSRFQQKHQCELYVNCEWSELFEDVYPNLKFIDVKKSELCQGKTFIPGLDSKSCKNFYCFYLPCNCYYASFDLGFYSKIPELKTVNLSKVASDMLCIEYKEERPKIKIQNSNSSHKRPYVCIATQSTSQFKYWNHENGWQIVVDYLIDLGYDVICIDKESVLGEFPYINKIPNNVVDKTGNFPIQERITDILNSEFFIGLSSGLSWLAWALKKPVVMISGFTHPTTEFFTDYRVFNDSVCNSCWNDISITDILKKQWSYCPREKDFECSKEISPEMVIEKIELLIKKEKITLAQ